MNKILILGSTGLLGSSLLKYFSKQNDIECFGLIRKNSDKKKLKNIKDVKFFKINYKNKNDIQKILNKTKPDLIINCIGVVKQLINNNEFSEIVRINSFLPHYLAEIANSQNNIRFIHFSTDCVFSGKKGNYVETDIPDAKDSNGRRK